MAITLNSTGLTFKERDWGLWLEVEREYERKPTISGASTSLFFIPGKILWRFPLINDSSSQVDITRLNSSRKPKILFFLSRKLPKRKRKLWTSPSLRANKWRENENFRRLQRRKEAFIELTHSILGEEGRCLPLSIPDFYSIFQIQNGNFSLSCLPTPLANIRGIRVVRWDSFLFSEIVC